MAFVLSTSAPVAPASRGGGRRAGGKDHTRRAAAVSAVGGGGSRNRGLCAVWGGVGGEEKIARIGSSCGSGWRQRPVGLGRRAPTVVVSASAQEDEAEAVTKKWGLEAGLWKVFRSSKPVEDGVEPESKMDTAKKLLKRYGSAYLVTSISLSLVSITVCYALISAGVDVAGLLEKVGLSVTSNSERFGTFALAYAAHKAGPLYKLNPVEGLA